MALIGQSKRFYIVTEELDAADTEASALEFLFFQFLVGIFEAK